MITYVPRTNRTAAISPRASTDALIVPGSFVPDVERFLEMKEVVTPLLAALRRLAANRELVDTHHEALATMKINGTRGWMVFFSTHPPLEARIAALENATLTR